MTQYVMVCNGQIDSTTITGNLKNSCVGKWELYPLEMFMPTTQLTPETVATMFGAAVAVFLLAKSFQLIKRQFFN